MPAELRKVILSVVAQHADAATWDKMHEAAKAEKTPLVKDRLYGLLAQTDDEALAKRALDLSLTGEAGETNSAGLISGVARRHPELAFDFAVAHKDKVNTFVDSTSSSRYYPQLAASSLELSTIDKLQAFAEKNIAPTSRRDAETAVANIRYRNMVRTQRLPAVDAWLKKNG
jgi:aminopeptidase N